jgi:hypothetical protein
MDSGGGGGVGPPPAADVSPEHVDDVADGDDEHADGQQRHDEHGGAD